MIYLKQNITDGKRKLWRFSAGFLRDTPSKRQLLLSDRKMAGFKYTSKIYLKLYFYARNWAGPKILLTLAFFLLQYRYAFNLLFDEINLFFQYVLKYDFKIENI